MPANTSFFNQSTPGNSWHRSGAAARDVGERIGVLRESAGRFIARAVVLSAARHFKSEISNLRLILAAALLIGCTGCADTMRRSVSLGYEGATITYGWERDSFRAKSAMDAKGPSLLIPHADAPFEFSTPHSINQNGQAEVPRVATRSRDGKSVLASASRGIFAAAPDRLVTGRMPVLRADALTPAMLMDSELPLASSAPLRLCEPINQEGAR